MKIPELPLWLLSSAMFIGLGAVIFCVLFLVKKRMEIPTVKKVLLITGIIVGIVLTAGCIAIFIMMLSGEDEIRNLDVAGIRVSDVPESYKAGSGMIDKKDIVVTAVLSSGENVILLPQEYIIEPEAVPERGHDFNLSVSSALKPEIRTSVNCYLERDIYEEYPVELSDPEKVKAVLYTNGDLEFLGSGEVKTFASSSAVPWQDGNNEVKAECFTWIDHDVVIETMDYWFGSNNDFLGMTCPVPDSTRSMVGTFSDCINMIYCPDFSAAVSLTDMTDTFFGCISLKSASPFPGNLRIAERTFYGCNSLIEAADSSACVMLENMVSCYEECTSLATTSTPDSVKRMENCYRNCINIRHAEIPKNLIIGANTFAGCTELQEVTGCIYPICEDYTCMFQDCKSLSGVVSVKTGSSDVAAAFPGAAVSGSGMEIILDYAGETDEYSSREQIMKDITGQIMSQAKYYGSQITVVDAKPPETTAVPAETEPETETVQEITVTPEETLPVESTQIETEEQTKASTTPVKKKKKKSSGSSNKKTSKKTKKQKKGSFED